MRDTPTRLLDVTESLIAAEGVDNVSLRAINAAAEANVAAIHYHFGGKVDLVRAVLERRSGRLALARQAGLDRLGPEPGVRDLVEVLVVPFLDLARSEDGASWAGFLAALQRAGGPWAELVDDALGPQFEHVVAALGGALPDLDPDELRFRLESVGAIVTGPAIGPGAPAPGEVVEIATAILGAPARVHLT